MSHDCPRFDSDEIEQLHENNRAEEPSRVRVRVRVTVMIRVKIRIRIRFRIRVRVKYL
jgi:hypothetical protein